jgi:hypothetical protein
MNAKAARLGFLILVALAAVAAVFLSRSPYGEGVEPAGILASREEGGGVGARVDSASLARSVADPEPLPRQNVPAPSLEDPAEELGKRRAEASARSAAMAALSEKSKSKIQSSAVLNPTGMELTDDQMREVLEAVDAFRAISQENLRARGVVMEREFWNRAERASEHPGRVIRDVIDTTRDDWTEALKPDRMEQGFANARGRGDSLMGRSRLESDGNLYLYRVLFSPEEQKAIEVAHGIPPGGAPLELLEQVKGMINSWASRR